jgi:hypothetical protein
MSNFADEGKDIVHVMHSYGGVASSQNAQGLAEVDRTATGKTPSISRMVYLASLILPVGKSVQMLAGGYQAWPRTSNMSEQLTATFAGELTYPAYNHILVAYLMCERDKVFP